MKPKEYKLLDETSERIAHQLARNAEECGQTILHCTYISKQKYVNGGWVNIWPTTYLVDENNLIFISLLHADGVPMSPEKHYFKKPGEVFQFTLLFPGLPKDWKKFSFREMTGSLKGFTIDNIPRNETGVYHVHLS